MQEVLNLKQKALKKFYLKQCDIFATTETNLKDKEKVNINGYKWAGKNRASEGGRGWYRIPNKQ